jgi:ParB family chromosome partitioning protein
MAKQFAPRIAKKERKAVEVDTKLYRNFDEKLLEGAKLEELNLTEIVVKDQVRTKFNEASLRELAQNIQANGLIQPLVVHRENNRYVLICGERRFRAMGIIAQKTAPCFVIENKSTQELMAIQFSENSSREALHYIDKADGIFNYQVATKASERKVCEALGISKSEVHRSLIIAKMDNDLKEAAKTHDIEKYVLLEYDALEEQALRKKIARQILIGEVKTRADLRKIIRTGGALAPQRKGDKGKLKTSVPNGLTANAFLKAMETTAKSLDPEAQKMLKKILEETQNAIE